jgi:hypothetical protein
MLELHGLKFSFIPSFATSSEKQKTRLRTWIEALRSGKYTQARGALRVVTYDQPEGSEKAPSVGFCCLGVARDLVKDELKGRWEEKHWFAKELGDIKSWSVVSSFVIKDSLGKARSTKDKDLRDMYNFTLDPEGLVCEVENYGGVPGCRISLITLNDASKWTFPQIADLVEIALNGGVGEEHY